MASSAGLLLRLIAGRAEAQPPLIAGAADLQFALEDVARRFQAATGQPVRLSLGSGGARAMPEGSDAAAGADAAMGHRPRGDRAAGERESLALVHLAALPLHAARRNGLAVGAACTVPLPKDAIHTTPRLAAR